MPIICVIAEADPFIANLLLRFAEESGVSTVRAKTGQELSALVRQFRPEALIVEPELPGEQRGWEVVRALRAEAEATAEAEAENGASPSTLASSLTSTSPPAVISCSWLEKTEAQRLLGPVAWHLQKPNLFYGDFVKALEAAGILVQEHSGQSDVPQ